MNHRCKLLLCLLPVSVMLQAQDELRTKEKYEYEDAVQLWRSTLNPAGLSLDTLINRGISYFDLSRQKGTHHLVQDGNAYNQLLFKSERYQRIGKYLYGYGSFIFDMGRQFERSWSDVIRSHNANPYFSGSSIAGKYDFQNFDLSASLATLPIHHFTYGVRLDYKVGDLSRLKDPRSRTNLADYRLIPAVTYSWKQHTWGVSGHYRRRKEKIPNITTVQTDPNLKYYTFTGMEYISGTVGGYSGFERQFTNHEFGAELSYSYKNSRIHSLTSLAYSKGKESVFGDTKYEPGKYAVKLYKIQSRNRFYANRFIHLLDVSVDYEQGYADEYRQEKVTEKDPVTGIESAYWRTLITYEQRYKVTLLNGNIHYKMMWVNPLTGENTAYVGILGKMNSIENKYMLPVSSLKYSNAGATLEGGYAFLRKGGRALWIEAGAGYNASLSASLDLADSTTDYAQNVLIPDMDYYGASYFRGYLQVQYQLPVTVKKHTSIWFVKATGDYLKTNKHTDASMFSLTFGLYH